MATHNLVEVVLTGQIADISTADQIYIPVPNGFEGDIIEIRTAIDAAISGADADITTKIAGTAVTNGLITVAQSGSAAGDTDVSNPTGARTVRAGDAIEVETDGASTGTAKCNVVIVIRR